VSDVAAGFEEAIDCHALLQMLAVIPAVELGLVGGVDIHRRQQHAFSGHWHLFVSCLHIFGAPDVSAAPSASNRAADVYCQVRSVSGNRSSSQKHAAQGQGLP
jgi:hypothetical protein